MNNALLGVILNARSDFFPIDYQQGYILGINIRYPIRKKSEGGKSEPRRCNIVNAKTIITGIFPIFWRRLQNEKIIAGYLHIANEFTYFKTFKKYILILTQNYFV